MEKCNYQPFSKTAISDPIFVKNRTDLSPIFLK